MKFGIRLEEWSIGEILESNGMEYWKSGVLLEYLVSISEYFMNINFFSLLKYYSNTIFLGIPEYFLNIVFIRYSSNTPEYWPNTWFSEFHFIQLQNFRQYFCSPQTS